MFVGDLFVVLVCCPKTVQYRGWLEKVWLFRISIETRKLWFILMK
jgi:hypothetical protein